MTPKVSLDQVKTMVLGVGCDPGGEYTAVGNFAASPLYKGSPDLTKQGDPCYNGDFPVKASRARPYIGQKFMLLVHSHMTQNTSPDKSQSHSGKMGHGQHRNIQCNPQMAQITQTLKL